MTFAGSPSRPHRPLTRGVALLALAALLGSGSLGCLTTHLQGMGASGPGFALEEDEKRLWEESRAEEKKLREKAVLYDDPILADYLDGLARRVVPAGVREQDLLRVRVHVIKDPALNAFTFPTGSIYVHTGLLARVENEAQLEMVLAHETAHATERHALRFDRSARNKAIGFSIASLAASIAVAGAAGKQAEEGDWSQAEIISQVGNILASLGLQLAFIASVNGYGRDLEREADATGLERLAAAGYDPRQAPRVFELLKDDKGDKSKMEVFFFGSHPRLDERIETTKELLATRYAGAGPGVTAADPRAFQMRTRVIVRDDAAQNLEAGRYGLAEAGLGRVLALTPGDPVAHFLYGQLFDRRAGEAKTPAETARLRAQAEERYAEAARLDARYADPHRALGILWQRAGEKERALTAFRKYIELRPDAPDARQVKDYILELEAS